MQLKTINQTIQNKIDQWLASITDKGLARRVRDNIVVSGGSIANMLLGIPPNDYDIYIQNMDVLIDLCQYYCQPKYIRVLDGRKKQQYVDEYCKEKGYSGGIVSGDTSIMAVILRTLKEDQVKLELTDGGVAYDKPKENEGLSTAGPGQYQVVYLSPNAISLSDDIQIVCRFHGTPEQIHQTFDFVHATNYWTDQMGVVVNANALVSLLTKQLKYIGSHYPLTSIIRMKKFLGRGFNINAGEILKILYQVSELNLNDPDVLQEQLIGVDIAYFEKVLAILRDTPSEKYAYNYLAEIIDRVFGDSLE